VPVAASPGGDDGPKPRRTDAGDTRIPLHDADKSNRGPGWLRTPHVCCLAATVAHEPRACRNLGHL